MADDFDSPWKEALDEFFEAFLALLFPVVHAAIDWSRGYESLDTELRQIMRGTKQGGKRVDKLAKVWLRDGQEQWLLIHIEIQSQQKAGFGRRMYVYSYKLFDRFDQDVLSLAVLGDDNPHWRPDQFSYGRFGCRLEYQFPIVKLLDYAGREEELEASTNPFAMIVLAHLQALKTRSDPLERRSGKMRLIKGLLQRGFGSDQIRRLFKFLDWLLQLPPDMEKLLWREVDEIAEEKSMPYVPSYERIFKAEGVVLGRREGLHTAVQARLKKKFGRKAQKLSAEIQQIENEDALLTLLDAVDDAESVDDVRATMAKLAR